EQSLASFALETRRPFACRTPSFTTNLTKCVAMMNERYIMDDLLVKYLLEEATEEEIVRVQQWIEENEANKKQYEQLKQIWTASKQLRTHATINEGAAWSRLQQRIRSGETKKQRTFSWKKTAMGMAAGLVLLLSAGI